MVTRIRRAVVAVALTLLLMATALAGVAWAANTIHCPGVTSDGDGYCDGTDRNDVMYGTGAKTRCMRGGERTPCTGVAGATRFTARRVRRRPRWPRKRLPGERLRRRRLLRRGREARRSRGRPIVGNLRSEKHWRAGQRLNRGRRLRPVPGRDPLRARPRRVLYNKGFDKVAERLRDPEALPEALVDAVGGATEPNWHRIEDFIRRYMKKAPPLVLFGRDGGAAPRLWRGVRS